MLNQVKYPMERKHRLPDGKLEASINKSRYDSPKKCTDKINLSFQAATEDFPLLNESVSTKSKTSGKLSQVTFSYSDKLKAVPQVPSSKICRFFGTSDCPRKSETDLNRTQSLYLTNDLSKVPEQGSNDLLTNFVTNKEKNVKKSLKSFHSMPNQQFSTRKRDPPEENNGLEYVNKSSSATEKSISANEGDVSGKLGANLNNADKLDDEGWTVYQKHSVLRKSQLPNKSVEANNFKKGFKEKIINSEKASETGNIYDKNLNSYIKTNTISKRYSEKAGYKKGNLEAKVSKESTLVHSNERYEIKVQSGVSSIRSGNFKTKANPNISLTSTHSSKHVYQDESLMNNKFAIKTDSKNSPRNETSQNQMMQTKGMCGANQNSEAKSDGTMPVKSKKKRKSKVKRLAARQSNKLLIITPEAHTRILTHSTNSNVKSQSNIFTNFTDNEEYPELGMGVALKNNKKTLNKASDLDTKVESQVCSEKHEPNLQNIDAKTSQTSCLKVETKESAAKVADVVSNSGQVTQDAKLPVHSNHPIKISLFDMLWTGKSKKKDAEVKSEEDSMPENSPVKLKKQKVIVQSVNPLSSSNPVEKRGKEREKPKVKKPSKMRKLILLGRQMKRESLAAKDSNTGSGMQTDNGGKSDLDNDGDNLSSNVSSEYQGAIDGNSLDIYSNSNLNVINSTLEELGLSLLVSSCEKEIFSDEELQEYKLLLETLSLSTQSVTTKLNDDYSEETENSTKSNSILLSNSHDSCCENDNKTVNESVEIVDTEVPEDSKKNLSCKIQNIQTENIFNESSLLEDQLNCQLVEGQVSALDSYFNTLVQTIVKDCMSEINLVFAKNASKQRHENPVTKSVDFSNSTETASLTFDQNTGNLKNNVTECGEHSNLYDEITQNKLHTIVDYGTSDLDGFSDIKSSDGGDNSPLVCADKRTSAYDKVLTDNSSVKDHSKKFGLFSGSINIEEFSNNCTSDDNFIPSMVSDCKQEIVKEELVGTDIGIKSSEFIQPEHPKVEVSVKEKTEAAKILLHSRKFRDYCTHFVTKELDETVFNLIDDLARFQDRLHQKDPVKARMKRRLMYGIKEIKKHMKLKKLKGIIIATDIEDNKTEGGLNDLVNEMLTLAEAYHIPYVFSHKRFNLGKVCRKPAPVSCVGIINYEGSEKNFKKMLELQEECKCDYNTLTKKIVEELTDNQIEMLFDTVQKSIPPFEVNKVILKELFGTTPPEIEEKIKTISLPSKEPSELNIDAKCFVSDTNSKSFKEVLKTYGSEDTVTSCFINPEKLGVKGRTSDKSESITAILTKYNVIKP